MKIYLFILLWIILNRLVNSWVASLIVGFLWFRFEKARRSKPGAVSVYTFYRGLLNPIRFVANVRFAWGMIQRKRAEKANPLKVGGPAANCSFVSLDGKVQQTLFDRLQPGRMMVLNFGSCS